MIEAVMAGEELASTSGAPAQGPLSGPQGGLTRRPSRNTATMTFSMEVFDNEVVPSSLSSITPILRVAAEIEPERPRVAYLCECLLPSIINHCYPRMEPWIENDTLLHDLYVALKHVS